MKVTMVSSSFIIVFLLAVLLLVSATHSKAQADRVNPLLPICKTVGGGSTYFGIDFCMSALGSDSRSHDAAGYRDFSIIAVDLLNANATSTGAKIGGLLKQKPGGGGGKDDNDATTESLLSCQALYSGIVDLLPGCAAAIKGGKLDLAALSLEEAASAAKECDDVFRKNKVAASPLTAEDDSAFKLAKLAVALLGFAG